MAAQKTRPAGNATREQALSIAWSGFKKMCSPGSRATLCDADKDAIARRFKQLSLLTVYHEGVILRGGGYLHFFHGLSRNPTDIDFIATASPSTQIHLETAQELAGYGIEVTTHKPSQKSNGGIFFSFKLIWPEDYCQVQIEFSRKELLLPPISLQMEESGHVFLMQGLSLQEQGAQKIRALIQRDVPTPRDIIDLHFLVTKKKMPFDLDFVMKVTSDKPGKEHYSPEIFSQKIAEIGKRLENMYGEGGLEGILDFGAMQRRLLDWAAGRHLQQ